MPSSNKTPYLHLNSFLGSDVPKRVDFNNDNLIVDQAVKNHVQNQDMHFTGEEKLRVDQMFHFTGYMGDGKPTKTIILPFSPAFVFVYCVSLPLNRFDSSVNIKYSNMGFATQGEGTWGIDLNDNVLEVHYDPKISGGEIMYMNALANAYTIVALRGNTD